MIPLKENLDDFLPQIELLSKKIATCKSKEELYTYLKIYKTLCYLYGVNENCQVYVKRIEKNNYYRHVFEKESNRLALQSDEFFLSERKKLKDIILCDLFALIDLLDNFRTTSYYNKHHKIYDRKIKAEELHDILINFFKDENKELLQIYEQLLNEKRFYRLKDDEYLKSNALSLFNPLDKKSSVLIRGDLTSLRFLEAYIHEIAHVFDSKKLLEDTNEFTVVSYNSESFFNETISTAYSLDLYLYLIKNNLYKDDAIIGLSNTLIAYSLALDSASLLCALTRKDFYALTEAFPTKREIVNMLKKDSKDFIVNDNIAREYLNETVDVTETIQYTYGYLLSKTLLKDKDSLNRFLSIRKKNLTIEELKEDGFDLEASPKVLTKHFEEYLD